MVCPVGLAGTLDFNLRRLVQNPYKILQPYISNGMTVLDLGCGPGFFTIDMAKLAGSSGKVIAADLQEGMLALLDKKIQKAGLYNIRTHKCGNNKTGLSEKVDFILVFYMLHEVEDQDSFIRELKTFLKPGGKVLIVEPKFHVTEKEFQGSISLLKQNGFDIIQRPGIFFSRTVVAENAG